MNAVVSTVKIRARPLVSRRNVVTRVGIIPEMGDVLTRYVCPGLTQCAGMFVGTEEQQRDILSNMHSLADHYNIVNSEQYVLRALIAGDEELAVSLAEATSMYHDLIDLIRSLIVRLPDLYMFPPEM